jgi:hypothetical protein
MGWTEAYKPQGMSYKDFFEKELNLTIIDSYTKNGVFYGAVQEMDMIYAIVILIRLQRDWDFNIMYKDMDESVHPYYYDCPNRILNILTEPFNDYAQQWRDTCRKKNTTLTKLKKGCTIHFTRPMSCYYGKVYDFTYVKNNIFSYNGRLIRIKHWDTYDYTIID